MRGLFVCLTVYAMASNAQALKSQCKANRAGACPRDGAAKGVQGN
jgi:hypothetical protein